MGPHKTSDNSFFFRRHTIYGGSPAERMSCVVGDLNNDGVPEFAISTRIPEQLHWFGRTGSGDWEPHPRPVVGGHKRRRPAGDRRLRGRPRYRTTVRPPCAVQTGREPRGPVASPGAARSAGRRALAAGCRFRWGRTPGYLCGRNGLDGLAPCAAADLSKPRGPDGEHIIDAGVGTHEAQVIELDGRVGIVSKPYRSLQDSAPRPAGVDALYLYLPACGFP